MLELVDKISTILNKYEWNYQHININFLSKNEKAVYYDISIKYNDDKLINKKYKKYMVPYNRKKKVNERSLENLRYIKKENNLDLNLNINSNIENLEFDKNIKKNGNKHDDTENIDIQKETVETIKTEFENTIHNIYDIQNKKDDGNDDIFKNDEKNIDNNNSINIDLESNINETHDDEIINVDNLINEDINNTNCDNCKNMDNNLFYLSNRLQKFYLDVLKEYDNIVDKAYYININLEELINLYNVKDKNFKLDIKNIIQNKKKITSYDISCIDKILTEYDNELPHISQLFRNKLVDPLIDNIRFVKEEYNDFITLIN